MSIGKALYKSQNSPPLGHSSPHPYRHQGWARDGEKRPPRTVWAERLRRVIPARYERADNTVAEIAAGLGVTEKTVVGILGVSVRERRMRDVAILPGRDLGRIEIGRLLRLESATVFDYLRELELAGDIESSACPHWGR